MRKALVSRAAAFTKADTAEKQARAKTEMEREGELRVFFPSSPSAKSQEARRRTSDLSVGSKVDDLVTDVESEDVVVLGEGGDGRGV